MPTYRLFGVDLTTDFPFGRPLAVSTEPAGLTFRVAPDPAPAISWDDFPPIYRSRFHTADGENAASLHRLPDGEVLRFPLAGDFYLADDRIVCHPSATVAATALATEMARVEISLLGPVLSYWLERRGLLTLHASVVGFAGRAFAFLSGHGGGKSGLAAQMMCSQGATLLADDLAVLEESGGEFRVHPAYPRMRMWPDEADHFLGGSAHLPLVHPDLTKRWVEVGSGGFGDFSSHSLPLAAIYAAQRRDSETCGAVEIHDLSRMDSMIELVRHSFAPELLEASGLQPRRLESLARLVQRIPVRRLVYRSGFDRLSEVVAAVLRHSG